ncbi:bifunctional UDP-N-acetylglucosamine diphosphorylase/glucosamine-1-phosphate N-acetyltransferase GlmU [Dasania sp. GY-MA-18]|uniref:Bifunctional protein GlmU n=1 Tax=Dasania phycosphaerae TaxID=2950436 RepID=A0A9J6RJ46_9GAMM|nr:MULTISPECIES: bifunctional UDP-N-acetylglucosamine diphosphorylase/glucosamine-1-phosphate N-acetyltransferase GlmU [Dasania]MCR8921965.1 bifunctional UDP-N-acetylglucosamine diphosphorylase/glucosamine-1-phosphate N-acetyltransferase GlmU [Dasania sp. GY-MA-18]MCZ0864393.1 bifunctional UDP-N-acetylglucosamine diphosphorylase/glucosamine-1-phosphate N-acetyltransferase GlmU [Dasania phycosphaerae]MCZ0868121.1 bifunctional UDP-N-acetylglucosamine diphosphorylase/glucosamine-1-phosphate N-acety
MAHEVVILAAGQGTRMRSKLPKVLHPVAGKPMLGHVISSAKTINAQAIHVVIGHGAEQVKASITDDVNWAIQDQQLGTGHAVAQALPLLQPDSTVLIAYGDVPLVQAQTLQKLLDLANETTLALLTVNLADPTGYGRIVRNAQNEVTAIVEQKDASAEQLAIAEVNTGIMAVAAKHLATWLPALSSENAQGEYYLTDIISMAAEQGIAVKTEQPEYEWEVQGANNREQVAELERYYQLQQAKALMAAGASLADPQRIDVRGKLTVGQDVSIDVNCVFIGEVELADDVVIGPNCVIENSRIGLGTVVKANSIIEQSAIAQYCDIGPFARLRPGTQLADKAKIGNFVETKKAIIGAGSKVNHLSYIGDCTIGVAANIGAGTITCNYDGVNKYQTHIGDGAFIGSNSALVAPVNIGSMATVGAGSTVTSDVAENSLAVARGKQRQINNWSRPVKKDKK